MYDELEKRANRMRQAQSELSERTKEHSDNMEKEAEVQSKKKEQPAYDSMVGQLQSKVEESLSQLSKDVELNSQQSEQIKQAFAEFARSVHSEVQSKLRQGRRADGGYTWGDDEYDPDFMSDDDQYVNSLWEAKQEHPTRTLPENENALQ